MPIRRDLRGHYRKEWLISVRQRILKRAADCCEQCGRPNHKSVVVRTWKEDGVRYMAWRRSDCVGPWWDQNGQLFRGIPPSPIRERGKKPAAIERTIYVVLGVAHLNHTPGDDRDDNLRALCGWCHLHHDQAHHKETREVRKDSGRPLLEAS